jgi:hypothetical protein
MSIDRFYEEIEFMARIPEAEIERLKQEISVQRLVAAKPATPTIDRKA